jgi:hypothetical protein
MKKAAVVAMILTAGLCLSRPSYAETEYYVQSVKARVMSAASFKAQVLAEVPRGSKLVSSGRKGSWIKVAVGEQEGFVFSMLLASHPPLERTSVISGEGKEIREGVRKRASSYTSAAAARGLAQDDRRRLSNEEKVDYDSIGRIEAFKLSQEEIGRFMEGKTL